MGNGNGNGTGHTINQSEGKRWQSLSVWRAAHKSTLVQQSDLLQGQLQMKYGILETLKNHNNQP